MRFATHFFPFTEPSIEAYVSCFLCNGAGCPVCRHSGWIEVGGAGMVDPNAVRVRRLRPRGVDGLRVRLGARADRRPPPRPARPPRALAERPRVSPRSSERMKVPVSWLREYVDTSASTEELAERLSISTLEVERIARRGVPDLDGNLGLYRVGRVRRGGQAPERGPAAALPGRRRRGRAAPDRLRRVELRLRRDGRRRAAGRACSRTARSSSGRSSAARSRTG